jgi:alpha-beta hydrolase superfamily lysophospholipase
MEVTVEPRAMQSTTFRLNTEDGVALFVHRWEPDVQPPKAVVQIAHGMSEHSARYARVAAELTAAGYAVYAHDHRGHGKTAAAPGDYGYFADNDGWARVVGDLQLVRERIAQDHPNTPLFILGHSMGSLIVRSYLMKHAAGLAGAVISGTSAGAPWLSAFGVWLSSRLRRVHGPRGHSRLIQMLTVGGYNHRFRPTRTDSDWLSRDAVEVDKFVSDPMCAFPFTVQGWNDVFGGIVELERPNALANIPKSLPIYLFSGERDPVGNETRGVRTLIDAMQRAGLTDVTYKFYPGGRHEMLNEENRAEVQRDLVAWLDAALARRASQAA